MSLSSLLAAALLAASAPSPIGEDAAACAAGKGPALLVALDGLKDRTGEIWLELYPANDADFLRDDTALVAEGKTFRRTRGHLPGAGPVSICVRVPRPGRYALMLRHNRVGRDRFSIWRDGAGVPGNRSLGRRTPSASEAAIEAGAGVTPVTIRMQYLRGFGFAPLG